jgi:adenine-specific DNA-methyltransferase
MAPPKLKKKSGKKTIAVLRHSDKRRNLPTAEFQEVMQEEEKTPIQVAYDRRNRDLDPQLVWRGKDEQDWSDLVVHAPPLYIQEKVHPKVLIDDLQRESTQRAISEGTQRLICLPISMACRATRARLNFINTTRTGAIA